MGSPDAIGISATVQRLKRHRKSNVPVVTAGTAVSDSSSVSDISSSTNVGGVTPNTGAGANGGNGDGSSTSVPTRMEDVIKYPLSGSASPPF